MYWKKGLTPFVFICLMFSVLSNVQAQDDDRSYRGPEHEKERAEPKGFASKLWYGGGLNLGFNAYNGQSAFGVGISPMVGYKFWGPFSAGPRLSFTFTSLKVPGARAVALFDTEAGAFLRIRAYKGLFVQGELSNSWRQEPVDVIGNKITKRTVSRFNQYVGIGYNFANGSGGPGSEISVMYNFAIANDIDNSSTLYDENPLIYRFSFTYGF